MKRYLFYCVMTFLLFSCQKIERSSPIGADDIAPGQASNVKVENIPGGANLTYTLPDSKNLLYMLAEYSIKEGEILTQKSSYYKNSITLEGFPNTNTYDVKLYAVSRGDKKSEPVLVKVNPLTPPVISVFQSLTLRPTFGGVNVQFLNTTGANIKLNILTPDSFGDLTTADIFYTSIDSGNFSARGYDSIPRRFGVFVRDRWNNYSDTVFADITPFYEAELDKSKFKAVHLPTDTYQAHSGFSSVEALWDGVWHGGAVFHTAPVSGIPQWFTFDLGLQARLSRFKFYHRYTSGGTDAAYYAGDPEVMEVWGSNNPNPDGSWDNSWTLLGHFQSVKPSGNATPNTEDIQFATVDGEDFEFPLGNPPVRYLRVKILKTWGSLSYMYMSELTFWGSAQ